MDTFAERAHRELVPTGERVRKRSVETITSLTAQEAYIAQLALYRAVLAQLYPGRLVSAALVWTYIPDLMELSPADLDSALGAVTSP